MKERPILFNAEMVNAVLDGRKTQTRRIMKPQPSYRKNISATRHYGTFFHGWNLDHEAVDIDDIIKYCPYGKPGDQLWVRETFGITTNIENDEGWPGRPYKNEERYEEDGNIDVCTIYRSDGHWEWCDGDGFSEGKSHWKPSIHMARKESRIQLEITDINFQQVCSISEKDSMAEGCSKAHIPDLGQTWETYKQGFEYLWDSINKKNGFGWDANPWVWVVDFKRVAK